jgi:hypothetical protein
VPGVRGDVAAVQAGEDLLVEREDVAELDSDCGLGGAGAGAVGHGAWRKARGAALSVVDGPGTIPRSLLFKLRWPWRSERRVDAIGRLARECVACFLPCNHARTSSPPPRLAF